MKYQIKLSGCNDETEFEMDLEPLEVVTLERVAALSDKFGGGCRPTLEIKAAES